MSFRNSFTDAATTAVLFGATLAASLGSQFNERATLVQGKDPGVSQSLFASVTTPKSDTPTYATPGVSVQTNNFG